MSDKLINLLILKGFIDNVLIRYLSVIPAKLVPAGLKQGAGIQRIIDNTGFPPVRE